MILGINSAYHESSAALIDRGGNIIAFAEEERFNRFKHGKKATVSDAGLQPTEAIAYVLKAAGITPAEVSRIGFSLHPDRRFELNNNVTYPYVVADGEFGTLKGETAFRQNVFMGLNEYLQSAGFKAPVSYLNHHLCHGMSALVPSGFPDPGVLIVDGIGELEATSVYSTHNGHLKRELEINFPHSLGFLWEKLSDFLGFSIYGACKAMGLASYGNPEVFRKSLESAIRLTDRGYELSDTTWQLRSPNHEPLECLFGLRALPQAPERIDPTTKPYADLAAALQMITEEVLIHLIDKNFPQEDICMGGGVALNCVANGKIAERFRKKRFYIHPATHDAGTALGAAFLALGERQASRNQHSAYLGPEFSEDEMLQAAHQAGLHPTYTEDIFRSTAELLAAGKVIAWFQGRMEVGPRALGNRSILADPRNPWVTDYINQIIKHREPFRPFCPSILAEHAQEWFKIPHSGLLPAKYMLAAFPAQEHVQSKIPAVVHVDGTSRVQVVGKKDNDRYHALLSEFFRQTGCPVLLNTSFNNTEPIVCKPEDAIHTFKTTKIDALVLGNILILKS